MHHKMVFLRVGKEGILHCSMIAMQDCYPIHTHTHQKTLSAFSASQLKHAQIQVRQNPSAEEGKWPQRPIPKQEVIYN